MAFDQIEIHSINRVSGVYCIRLNFDANAKWISTGSKTRIPAQACLISMSTFTSSRATEELQNALGTLKIELSDHPDLVYDDGTGNIIRECFEQALANNYLVHAIVARFSNDPTPVFQEFVFAGTVDPREMTIAHRRVPPNDRRSETISCEFTPAKRLDNKLGGLLDGTLSVQWEESDLESNVRPFWLCVVDEPGVDGAFKFYRHLSTTFSRLATVVSTEMGDLPVTSVTHDLAYGSHPLSLNVDVGALRDNVGNGTTIASAAGHVAPAGNWAIKLTNAIDKIFTACDVVWDGVFPDNLQMRFAHWNEAGKIMEDDGQMDPALIFVNWNYLFGINPYDGKHFKGPATFDEDLLCRDFLKSMAALFKSRLDIYSYNSDGLPIARFLSFGQTTGAFPALEQMPESSEDAFVTDKDGVYVTRRGFDGGVMCPANAVSPVKIEIPLAPYTIAYETAPAFDASRMTPNPALEFQDQWKCGFRGSLQTGGESETTYPLNPDGWVVGAHIFRYNSSVGIDEFPYSHDSGGYDGGNEDFYKPGGWAGYYPVHAVYDVDPGTLTNDEKKERQKNFLISYALYFGRYLRGERRRLTIQFKGVVAPNWSDIANGMTFNFQPITSDVEYIVVSIERNIDDDYITVNFEESTPPTLTLSYKVDGDGSGTGSIGGQGKTEGTNPPDLSSTSAVIVNPSTVHRNKIKPTITGVAALEVEGFDTATTAEVQFLEATVNGTKYVGFKAPLSIPGNVIWVLPNADGTSGYVLSTDGAGNLSWIAQASSLTGAVILAPATAFRNKIVTQNNSTVGLEIWCGAGVTPDLFEAIDSASSVQAKIDYTGAMTLNKLLTVNNEIDSINQIISINGAGVIGLLMNGFASQTANFITIKNDSAQTVFELLATGGINFELRTDDIAIQGTQLSGATNKIFQFSNNSGTIITKLDAGHKLTVGTTLSAATSIMAGSTNTPNTTLQTQGDISNNSHGVSLTVTNGRNDNLAIGAFSTIRISNATGNFSISGFASPQDGKYLSVFNDSTFNMTINNQDANSTAANRIITLSGGNEATVGTGLAVFYYDTNNSRWILESIKA